MYYKKKLLDILYPLYPLSQFLAATKERRSKAARGGYVNAAHAACFASSRCAGRAQRRQTAAAGPDGQYRR